PPLMSQVSGIIPFMPFSEDEQAVIVHGLITAFRDSLVHQGLRRECLPDGAPELAVHLSLADAHAKDVCLSIGAKGYIPELGVPSLRAEVERVVEHPVLLKCLVAVDGYLSQHKCGSQGPPRLSLSFAIETQRGDVVIRGVR
ncbi:hypothetical protein KEM52_004021, partial [Ascosphaera acerosa]